jgi:hypothetical protein
MMVSNLPADKLDEFFDNLKASTREAIAMGAMVAVGLKNDLEEIGGYEYGSFPLDVVLCGQTVSVMIGRPAGKPLYDALAKRKSKAAEMAEIGVLLSEQIAEADKENPPIFVTPRSES